MALEKAFSQPFTISKLRSPPLGGVLDDFCDWLFDAGFTWSTVRKHLGSVAHLNVYLAELGLTEPRQISQAHIDGFAPYYRPICRYRSSSAEQHIRSTMWSINRLVRYLKEMGICDFSSGGKVYEELLNEYIEWMRCYRGAAQGTLQRRQESLVHFFEWLRDDATEEGLSMLCPQDVESFFLEYSRDRGYQSRRAMQAALRTFFRFCHAHGYTPRKLDEAVPTLRTYKLARAPRGLTDEQAQVVLESISSRKTDADRRDYGILQMLYTYGVRGGQVRCLRLEDIHWARDEILFRATKKGKDVLLPLTQNVGEALLDYLEISRPRTRHKEIFLTCRAPYHPLTTTALAGIVRRRLLQAGIQMKSMGAYVLRHCFATRMLSQGKSIKSIADLLGHRHIETTFVYTKVDFQSLHAVALDWPEEEL